MLHYPVLSVVLLVAMSRGAEGNFTVKGGLSSQELQERCQTNRTAVFAHPRECQLYYNCSSPPPYLQECWYPQLFSTLTSRCEPFDDVTCGDRLEVFDCHDYHRFQCTVNRPSCKGLPDGMHVYDHSIEWNTRYIVCRSQRLVFNGFCPRDSTLQMTQLFHPQKRRCVSLYEVPRQHDGLEIDCTLKADGLYLDDVTFRPDVFYTCENGDLVKVDRCESGTFFDEEYFLCDKEPQRNAIMGL